MAKGKKAVAGSGHLFIEASGQMRLLDKSAEQLAAERTGPVECLGMTFETDTARRAYFLERLREKLQDPEFRSTDGFPLGEDEDILGLSDPPYYTACPNPFLADFIRYYGKPYVSAGDTYKREPFAIDVSEGRADVIYTAHSYHTKVPPKAIAKYIEHYTEPGDVVLDFFAGSGMTGVAARMCSSSGGGAEKATARAAILIDLSPAATFIACNYLWPCDPDLLATKGEALLVRISDEMLQSYQTILPLKVGEIVEYILWVECFICPSCQEPVVSEQVVKATQDIGTAIEFPCPNCGALVSKAPSPNSPASRLERKLRTVYDNALKRPRLEMWRVPRIAQIRDSAKIRKLVRLEESVAVGAGGSGPSPLWYPMDPLIRGERFLNKDCCQSYGITHIHHFYLDRQLATYSRLWAGALEETDYYVRRSLAFFVQSNGLGFTVMNRYQPTQHGKAEGGSQVNRYFAGTLYVPSMVAEVTPRYAYGNKLKRLVRAFSTLFRQSTLPCSVSTQSATTLRNIRDNSVDYIFVDPPFGRNLQYSELNQIWEAWLKVRTNRDPEAVMDSTRAREEPEYTGVMRMAFSEGFRVLKPGRWMTVEFHNSSNAVWTAIQEALASAGFVVADVRTLNKMQETYKQSRQGLVKQDLVISAYKPNSGLEARFKLHAGSAQGAWDFVREHLRHLPVFVEISGKVEVVAERQAFLLFDRMVGFHVQRGATVPMNAMEFFGGLKQRFPERDGMHFLPEQAAEYDRRRLQVNEVAQLTFFVGDERSAVQWLRLQFEREPQTYQEIMPKFLRELHKAKHEQLPELREILQQNFLEDDQGRWYLPDPNKQLDLEKLRERALLREFEEYKTVKQKRLKTFRTEAIRAGFKVAWAARDYLTIVSVAQKLPEDVLQEDLTILQYYDNAAMRIES